jgi:hypothetical protein
MTSKGPAKEISPKLSKTINKLQTRIKTSPDYEVHQELKAVANRFGSLDYSFSVRLLPKDLFSRFSGCIAAFS